MLSIEKLDVYYGAVHALKGVTLHADAGEIVTLIGANGAGKTTLLRAISGLIRPRAGVIQLEGRDISRVPPHEIVGLGISHNMRVNDNNLLIFGVAGWMQKASFDRNDQNDGVANGQVRSAESKTTMAPLFFASLETEATSWLKIRMGATQAMVTTKDEETAFDTDSFTDKEKTSDFNFNLGAGIKWNNLDFDLTLNEAFPLSGGYILSGDQETPATRASATYHF